ncbi:hypothetical protein DBR06_SOUSAS50410008, partial [Sousa chinensis]
IVGTALHPFFHAVVGEPEAVPEDEQTDSVVITSHAFVIIFLVMPIIIGGLGN